MLYEVITNRKTVAKSSPTTQTRKIVYKVLPGDNFWSISQKFNVDTQQILDWNRLSSYNFV